MKELFNGKCDTCGREQLPSNMSMCNNCANNEELGDTITSILELNADKELAGYTYAQVLDMYKTYNGVLNLSLDLVADRLTSNEIEQLDNLRALLETILSSEAVA